MKQKRLNRAPGRWQVHLGLVLMLVVLLAAGAAQLPGIEAAPAEGIDVLIGFRGVADPQLVGEVRGEIRRQFTIVDVIAASLPADSIAALAANPRVRYVEPDLPVFATGQEVPWGIDRVFGDENYSFSTWLSSTGESVGVAVLDTGIDGSHEDLHVMGGRHFYQTGMKIHEDDSYGDAHGHGTHVAGTIAARDNSIGVVGVAPRAELYAVKVLDDTGQGTLGTVLAGIEWAVDHDIPILNMSLGWEGEPSISLGDACQAAFDAGHLLISSAGNSGNEDGTGDTVGWPAKYGSVIAVAASDAGDHRAWWPDVGRGSSTGPDVELIAPGDSVLSTVPGNDYQTYRGTSMASPHVAGTAALIWGADPGLTNTAIRGVLTDTAEDLGLSSTHQGHGLVRADLAVARVAPLGVTVTSVDFGTVRTRGARTIADVDFLTVEGPPISDIVVSVVDIEGGDTPWAWGNGLDADTVQVTITITDGPAGLSYPVHVVIGAADEHALFTGESVESGTYRADFTLTTGPRVSADLYEEMSTVLTYVVTVR